MAKIPYSKKNNARTLLNHFEISAYLEPVQTFINQVKTHDVYHDDNDDALISLPGLDIEKLAMEGKKPFSATYNLGMFCEVAYQVVLFTQNNDAYIKSTIEILNRFDKLFIEPLREKKEMNKEGVDASQAYVNATKVLLFKVTVHQFYKVLHNVIDVVDKSYDIVTNYEMREWLIDFFKNTNSKKINYLLKEDDGLETKNTC